MTPSEILYLRRVLRDATEGRWRPISGGIVTHRPSHLKPDVFLGADEIEYYGGLLICESMTTRDAVAACAAMEALPAALDEIERLRGCGRLQLSRFSDTVVGRPA